MLSALGQNHWGAPIFSATYFGSYKTEELYRNEYNSLAEARTGWESYRAWYRYDRLHQGLRYRSPRENAKITRKSKLLVA